MLALFIAIVRKEIFSACSKNALVLWFSVATNQSLFRKRTTTKKLVIKCIVAS